MSKQQAAVEVKQEGDFKLKSKPKNLGKKVKSTIAKVDLTKPEATGEITPDVIKVQIPKKEEDAIQTQETNDSDAIIKEQPDGVDSKKVVEEIRTTEEVKSPIQEITAEEKEEIKEIKKEVAEAKKDEKVLGKPLPENIEKLVNFMEETGGDIQDYVRLNADYSNIDNKSLIKEYYKSSKPYLDVEDMDLMLEDFDYDDEMDEPKEIRKKKLAFKEEVAKAKNFLEETKSKYYAEIKLRPGTTQDQQKALDFFNRYTEEQKTNKAVHDKFVQKTKNLFTEDFKGFDFNLGEKKFRYSVKNPNQVGENQSDISNFVKTFLDDKGEIQDQTGYHKALYAASNADTIAQHFYEQGKADAVKEVVTSSKNISNDPRKTVSGDIFVGGMKVKAISGDDSSKLRIKKRKFN
tara:strand:- start:969 stop:2183 length:1215 start_codon:yes stop_codon:yes gene_type:complete